MNKERLQYGLVALVILMFTLSPAWALNPPKAGASKLPQRNSVGIYFWQLSQNSGNQFIYQHVQRQLEELAKTRDGLYFPTTKLSRATVLSYTLKPDGSVLMEILFEVWQNNGWVNDGKAMFSYNTHFI